MDNLEIKGTVLMVFEKQMSKIEFKQFYQEYINNRRRLDILLHDLQMDGIYHIELKTDELKIYNDEIELEVDKKSMINYQEPDNTGIVKIVLETEVEGNDKDPKADVDIPNLNNLQYVMRNDETIHHINSSNGKVSILTKYSQPSLIRPKLTIKIDNYRLYNDIMEINFDEI